MITLADMKFFYSGGGANADPSLSIGGQRSSVEIESATLANLFPTVSLLQSESGHIDYRCIYFINSGGYDLEVAAAFIAEQTTFSGSDIAIGLDAAGIGDGLATGVATTISPDTEAPVGVTFADYPTSGSGLAIGLLAGGEGIAIWIRRTIDPTSSVPEDDDFRIQVSGVPI